MTEDIIIMNANLNTLTFTAISRKGFEFYKLHTRSSSNKNIDRLKPFITAEVMKMSVDSNLVVRLRPIYDFIKEKKNIKKFDFLLKRLDLSWDRGDEFENLFDFLSNLVGDDEYRVLIIELYLLRLHFKNHNILLEVENCFHCNINYDLEGFDMNLASMVCHGCNSKDPEKKVSNKIQKNIEVLKLITNFWENRSSNKRVLSMEASTKNIKKLLLSLEYVLSNAL